MILSGRIVQPEARSYLALIDFLLSPAVIIEIHSFAILVVLRVVHMQGKLVNERIITNHTNSMQTPSQIIVFIAPALIVLVKSIDLDEITLESCKEPSAQLGSSIFSPEDLPHVIVKHILAMLPTYLSDLLRGQDIAKLATADPRF